MERTQEKLLEAHVEYELSRMRDEHFNLMIRQEVDAAFPWAGNLLLGELFSPAQILGILERNVIRLPLSDAVIALVAETAQNVLASPANAATTLEDVFPQTLFYKLVEKGAALDTARRGQVQKALYTHAYFRLISDVIIQTVKEFMLTENPLVKRVPGMRRLFQSGREAAGKAAPEWLQDMETKLRETLEDKMRVTAQGNEDFFMDLVNEKRLMEASQEIWQKIAPVPLAEHLQALNPDDPEAFVALASEFWLHFRATPYFKRLSTELIYTFFDKHGPKPIKVFLEEMGISKDMVARELAEILTPAMNKAIATGFLKDRLYAHLQPFYQSAGVKKILDQQ